MEEMVSEIRELKTECSGYKERLEKIKSAANHVTPQEKEKVQNAMQSWVNISSDLESGVRKSLIMFDFCLGLQRPDCVSDRVEKEEEIGNIYCFKTRHFPLLFKQKSACYSTSCIFPPVFNFCFPLRLQTWSMRSWRGILRARRSSWWVKEAHKTDFPRLDSSVLHSTNPWIKCPPVLAGWSWSGDGRGL